MMGEMATYVGMINEVDIGGNDDDGRKWHLTNRE